MKHVRISALVATVIVLLEGSRSLAEDAGQQDLDQATELQLKSDKTFADVEKVIALCESALQKGLDENNGAFAKQLLVSALWQHASRLSAAILESANVPQKWQTIRLIALRDLDKLLKQDEKFADAHLLRAKLQTLPGGNREEAKSSVEKAIELFKDNAKQRAEALIVRSELQEDAEKQLADLNQAVKTDPTSAATWQARAGYYLARGQMENAAKDFEKLLENDPKNIAVRQALTEALLNLEKYDLALAQVNKAIELQPDYSLSYTLRAQVYEAQEKTKEALADLEKALQVEPRNPVALLMRARLYFLKEDLAAARTDIDRLLQLRPGMARAILLRSMISAAQGRFADAVSDVKSLLRDDPKSVELRLQLASLYVADQRPRKAIELLNEVLADDKENWTALRARGDALLSTGNHADAVKDYNQALDLQADDDGILNNLAWVLATSPFDELRDGKRSIALATKACEVTKYEKPHILSTLAAAYAETGDFQAAIKWSSKAVELGSEKLKDQIDQLKKELESYQRNEKWRELQKVEDKPDPPRNVIET